MPRHIIRTVYDASQPQRVIVFRRDDGSFGFENQRFVEDQECWIPHGKFSESFCETLELAEREARERVPWLRVAKPAPEFASTEPSGPLRPIAVREISFDPAAGVRIVPELPAAQNYDAVYRAALSVRWNSAARTLYMVPRADRTPLEAYQRIGEALASEYHDELVLTPLTVWRDLSPEDQAAIRSWSQSAKMGVRSQS